ncbi:MAG: hypothetical protein KGL12_02840 [Rhodospirillales bacterium]|nr:hypothetical protein [Rhodospirillales bacterium]
MIVLEILSRAPFLDGAEFGTTGAYERIVARAHGWLDAADPANAPIADLALAQRDAHGRIAWQSDVLILRPADAARGNGRLLYEVNNRGRVMIFASLCGGAPGNDPREVATLGDALPLRRGFTLVWSGWDAGAPRAGGGLGITVPEAVQPDGSPIVAPIREEFISGTRAGTLDGFPLAYDCATEDRARCRLSVRPRRDAPARTLSDWAFAGARRIALLPAGTRPDPGAIYEFSYPACRPRVLGIGFAATRDLVAYLRHDGAAAALLGRRMEHALGFGISQAGRYLREHIALGFNRDPQGRRVFDGVLTHVAGTGRLFFNTRFAQPGRTRTFHEDRDFPEIAFPFSTAPCTDPHAPGAPASLLRGDGSDPKLIETNTGTEYWQKGASLLHTDPTGTRDLALPATVRGYFLAGTQHAGKAGMPADPGPCRLPRNPHDPMAAVRALLVALDAWVSTGRAPPDSRLPRIDDGTLVPADRVAFPAMPGFIAPRAANSVAPLADWTAPAEAPGYAVLVPQVDADGNEIAGIRLPEIAAPLGTYTGWNLYAAPMPDGELADRDGIFLPFAADAAAAKASGDARLSRGERADPAPARAAIARALCDAGLLLAEDAARWTQAR